MKSSINPVQEGISLESVSSIYVLKFTKILGEPRIEKKSREKLTADYWHRNEKLPPLKWETS